ncbi:MAG: hypothetical protein JXR76_25185 [Deltaproteobacteria bacterium]|nr:hypothetical protein [Deltaproteobacteria bacterium]
MISGCVTAPSAGGIFEVHVNHHRIWSRKRVRDEVAPTRDLGHIDKKKS